MDRQRFAAVGLNIMMLIALTAGAQAQGKLGVGLIIGEPTGVGWKYRISDANAVDGAVGLSPSDRGRFHFDYLWEKRSFEETHLKLHYGLGAAFGLWGSHYTALRAGDTYVFGESALGFGLRAVAGLTYEFPRSPFDAFVELAPLFIISPVGGVGLDAALGVRIYP